LLKRTERGREDWEAKKLKRGRECKSWAYPSHKAFLTKRLVKKKKKKAGTVERQVSLKARPTGS